MQLYAVDYATAARVICAGATGYVGCPGQDRFVIARWEVGSKARGRLGVVRGCEGRKAPRNGGSLY